MRFFHGAVKQQSKIMLKRKDPGRTFSPSRARKVLSRSGLGSCRSPRRGLTTSFVTPSKPTPSAKPGARPGNVSKGASANMKVVVRVRPLSQREVETNARTIVDVVDDKMVVFDPKRDEESFFYHGTKQKGRDMLKKENKNAKFLFDRVFGSEASNEEVFEGSTKGIVSSVLDGYNCSVFVYGATGAGKTYTMLGTQENPGITFRTMVDLFKEIDSQKIDKDFEIGVSYLEVYNEAVRDLLKPSAPPLHLREDGVGVVVAGLKMERITDPQKMFELLEFGNKNRTQQPTEANSESSRSHAVFQVFIKMKTKSTGQTKLVKLSMIDLAGSERGAATGCAGVRFKEGSNINKSLLALGNCINALADGLRHIPYRDSKLTRILKDSLGGNCQTVMIANVSPAHNTYEDSHNTLRYATRAKSIKVQIKRNIASVELHVSHYIKMVENLQTENDRLKKELLEYQNQANAAAQAPNPLPVNVISPKSHLPPAVAAAVAAINSKVKPDVSTTSVAVNTSPLKGLLNSDVLQRLKNDAERLYNEKAQLHQRYLSMDSSDKVLRLRIKMKQRTIDRIDAMSSTPSRKDKALNKVDKSLVQFTGRLTSVQECQESVSLDEQEINQHLEEIRQELQRLGVLDEISPSLKAFELEFLNQELSIKCQHLEKLVEYLDKELENQDEMLKKISTIFRNYYHLVRGHGHMTEEMIAEHKTVMQCLEGIKSVKWKQDENGAEPSNAIKEFLTEVPVIPGKMRTAQTCSTTAANNVQNHFQSTLNVAPVQYQALSPSPLTGAQEDKIPILVQSPVPSISSNLLYQTDDTASMLDSLGLLDSKVENILNTSVSSTTVEVGNYRSHPACDSDDNQVEPLTMPNEANNGLNCTFNNENPENANKNLNETFEKPDVTNFDLPDILSEAETAEVRVLNGTFSLDDDMPKSGMEEQPVSKYGASCLKKLCSPSMELGGPTLSPSVQAQSGYVASSISPRLIVPNIQPNGINSPNNVSSFNEKTVHSSTSSPFQVGLQIKKVVSGSSLSPTLLAPVLSNTRKTATTVPSPTFAMPHAPGKKVAALTQTTQPSTSTVKSVVSLKKLVNGGIGDKKGLHYSNHAFAKPATSKLVSINRRVCGPQSKLFNTPSKVKLAWNKENRNAAPSNFMKSGTNPTLVKNVPYPKTPAAKASVPTSSLNDTYTKASP